jgi:hypothetical protein
MPTADLGVNSEIGMDIFSGTARVFTIARGSREAGGID